ncbi:serine/threonine-protein kinase [Streptomyces sp. KMM 9044]|uniref:serine/threonine-protein kinase n=1 Tax=Streptomyces sp. KMM 9044 TaxID=2744474 RepID=UPI002151DE14|nr:serine/threonine-protein kinase [Streptomyces sp. KMM 9044]WAX78697.1 serine/threonine-protein kinase [Streptomyces sp. KMM 9044]
MAPQRDVGAGAEAELPEYAGHYRLESCLGSGGMGVVHLARSTSGLKLAVKVVHAEFARDREFRGRFRQEVAAARRVSGAFTAPVVDADPEAGRPWMATLFIPGPTLAQHVKRNGPMPPPQLRRLMAGLAEGLRDIHRVGVVHRDLKPSNVLLAEDGPKVIDFGISRPEDSELRTETGKLIGTPPFMAPEQFRSPREVGPSADIFALGSLLAHAATGRGPFDSDSPYVVAYQVVHDEPDLTGVPEELTPLVLRCLAKEPEERPSPDALMRELRSVAASYDTQTFMTAQAFIPAQRTDPGADSAGAVAARQEVPDAEDRDAEDRDAEDRDAAGAGPAAAPGPGAVRRGGPAAARRSVRPPLSKRALVGGGALALAVFGTLLSVQLLGDEPPARQRTAGTRTTPDAFRAWEAAPSGKPGSPQCSYGADRLVCALAGSVFALDPDDGRLLWRHATARTSVSGPPVVSGGLVQPALELGSGPEALDPGSGKPRWRQDAAEYNGLTGAGDMLLLTGADGTATGMDSASGDVLWTGRVPGHDAPYFRTFAGDPLAYVASTSDDGSSTRVTAVDPRSGAVRWDARLEGMLTPVGITGEAVVLAFDDPVLGDTQALVRYTPGSGETRRVTLPVPLAQGHGTVHGNIAYLTGTGGRLVAVDMAALRQRWSLETGVARGSAPVADGRHVYFTAPDGRLLAVDAREGRLAGQTAPRMGDHPDRVAATLPEPVIADGHVHATAPDGTVFAVDGRDPVDW